MGEHFFKHPNVEEGSYHIDLVTHLQSQNMELRNTVKTLELDASRYHDELLKFGEECRNVCEKYYTENSINRKLTRENLWLKTRNWWQRLFNLKQEKEA